LQCLEKAKGREETQCLILKELNDGMVHAALSLLSKASKDNGG
jgi:hypothetical protein